MNRPCTLFLAGLAAVALAASSGHAQSVPLLPFSETDAPTVVDRAHGVWSEGEVVHARGARYAARFDRRGLEFTPALGSTAPRQYPVRFELESIARGDVALSNLEHSVAPRLAGDTVWFDRSPDLSERYSIAGHGVEQSFLFAERPAGSGDLVVRLRLRTELSSGISGRLEDGLELDAPGFGGVSIGGVTGIDAAGRRQPGWLRHENAILELVLPAGFVETARYPLVLDPVIGTRFLIAPSASGDDDTPDVAYESANDEYLVVWARAFSQDRSEIWGQRVDGATRQPVGSLIAIYTNGFSAEPTVATAGGIGVFAVAWQSSSLYGVWGPYRVRVRKVDAATGTLGTMGTAPGGGNHRSPDLGGARSNGSFVMLTWDDDAAGITVARVDLSGTTGPLPFLNPTVIGPYPGAFGARPRISKSDGGRGRWLVVWEWDGGTPAILGQVIDSFPRVIGAELRIAVDTRISENAADCDGDGSSFVVVFDETESGLTGSRDIYCQRIAATATTARLVGTKIPVRVFAGSDAWGPTVACLGPKYLVAWSEARTQFLDAVIFGVAIDPATCTACGSRFQFGTRGGRRQVDARIGAQYAGGGSGDEALMVCASYQLTLPFEGDILGLGFEAVGPGGAVTNVSSGCGGGGTCSVTGPFAFANTVGIELRGADAGATLAALNIGGDTSALNPCGPCTLLDGFVALPVPINRGSASFALRIGCNLLALRGDSLRFQYVVAPTSATPCLGLPASLSNVVDATFDY